VHTSLIAIAAVAAIQPAPAAPQAGFQLLPVPARMEVTGYGEVKTMPDVATINYIARGEGPGSDDAVRAMTASETRIDAAIHAIDRNAEPQTSEVKVAAVRSTDCKEQEYGPQQLSTGACAIAGYVATQSATLHTLAVKDAGTIVGLVGRAGGQNPRVAGFDMRDNRLAQQQAIDAALADARTKALGIASASHVKLGPILNVTSGARNDKQQIVVSGSRITQANSLPAVPPPIAVSLTPEPITTNSYVTVTYSIIQ
jgi:uncharacterized protein